jgi:hypothetical protein
VRTECGAAAVSTGAGGRKEKLKLSDYYSTDSCIWFRCWILVMVPIDVMNFDDGRRRRDLL